MLGKVTKGASEVITAFLSEYGIQMELRYSPSLNILDEYRKSYKTRSDNSNVFNNVLNSVNDEVDQLPIDNVPIMKNLGLYNRSRLKKFVGAHMTVDGTTVYERDNYIAHVNTHYFAEFSMSFKLMFTDIDMSDNAEILFLEYFENRQRTFYLDFNFGDDISTRVEHVPYNMFFSEMSEMETLDVGTSLRCLSFTVRIIGPVFIPYFSEEQKIQFVHSRIYVLGNLLTAINNFKLPVEEQEGLISDHLYEVVDGKIYRDVTTGRLVHGTKD